MGSTGSFQYKTHEEHGLFQAIVLMKMKDLDHICNFTWGLDLVETPTWMNLRPTWLTPKNGGFRMASIRDLAISFTFLYFLHSIFDWHCHSLWQVFSKNKELWIVFSFLKQVHSCDKSNQTITDPVIQNDYLLTIYRDQKLDSLILGMLINGHEYWVSICHLDRTHKNGGDSFD